MTRRRWSKCCSGVDVPIWAMSGRGFSLESRHRIKRRFVCCGISGPGRVRSKRLFAVFEEQLRNRGYRPTDGQEVDAPLIAAPLQRMTGEEKARARAGGSGPDIWPEDPARGRRAKTQMRVGRSNIPGPARQGRPGRCWSRRRPASPSGLQEPYRHRPQMGLCRRRDRRTWPVRATVSAARSFTRADAPQPALRPKSGNDRPGGPKRPARPLTRKPPTPKHPSSIETLPQTAPCIPKYRANRNVQLADRPHTSRQTSSRNDGDQRSG